VRRHPPADEVATFAREWNAALALVLVIAALLVAAGHYLLAVVAVALAAAAVVARWTATRHQSRGFYWQEKASP
jgi:hypothetical protein